MPIFPEDRAVDQINHERTRVVLCAPRWIIESAAYIYLALPCLPRGRFFVFPSDNLLKGSSMTHVLVLP